MSEARKARNKLAVHFHPDKVGKDGTAPIQKLNEAITVFAQGRQYHGDRPKTEKKAAAYAPSPAFTSHRQPSEDQKENDCVFEAGTQSSQPKNMRPSSEPYRNPSTNTSEYQRYDFHHGRFYEQYQSETVCPRYLSQSYASLSASMVHERSEMTIFARFGFCTENFRLAGILYRTNAGTIRSKFTVGNPDKDIGSWVVARC